MSTTDGARVAWRRSSYSGTSGNCVDVADLDHAVGVRDSKNPTGPALSFSRTEWAAFLTTIKHGRLDR